MFRLQRILFPIDFSDRSIATARRVKVLAGHFHSEVILLHVIAPLRADLAAFDLTWTVPGAVAALKEQLQRELQGFLAGDLGDLRVRRILAEGDPASSIVQHAQALDADLIMMPTRGLGVFRRYVIGSVTAKVLHDAGMPVWTGIHHEAAPPFSPAIEHVLCAVDLGPHSVAVLKWASGLAGALDARVTVCHVVPDLEPLPGRRFDPECGSSLDRWTREEIQKIQDAAGTNWDIHIETGEAAKRVVHAAGALKADLLVIGRSPAEAITGRLRTHAYAIVGQSPCPVVSV